MNEHKLNPENNEMQISFEQAFQQLQEILNILEKNDLTIPEYCHSSEKIKDSWEYEHAFPIAREGMDGIRAIRMSDGNFRIFFTNGFEDPNNPKRVEITKKLRLKGFDVI